MTSAPFKKFYALRASEYEQMRKNHLFLQNSNIGQYVLRLQSLLPFMLNDKNLTSQEKVTRFAGITRKIHRLVFSPYLPQIKKLFSQSSQMHEADPVTVGKSAGISSSAQESSGEKREH